jgi:D-lactate dehydrogenase
MRIACFDSKRHDREFLSRAASTRPEDQWVFFENRLTIESAEQSRGFDAVCVFVHDSLDRATIAKLAGFGVKLIALRCAGFNNVDLPAAEECGLRVVRVPAYSPHAVAEHAVGMILSLNRRFHRAYHRVRDSNFALEGLLGFDVHGKTVGVIGTGKIGEVFCRIIAGFGVQLLAYDVHLHPGVERVGGKYVPLDELLQVADIISLHCPLLESTHHLINDDAIARMKQGVMLINTSRGALVDTEAVIRGLKSGKIGYLGLDVYEEEENLFFEDRSTEVLQDDVFARLLTFPNVLVTAHQAFFTQQALEQIAQTTITSIGAFAQGEPLAFEIKSTS